MPKSSSAPKVEIALSWTDLATFKVLLFALGQLWG